MSKKTNTQVEAVEVTVDNELEQIRSKLATFTTKSAKIRYLNDLGWNRSKIAKELNIIYQHVRNVLITPIKKTKE